MADPFLGYGDDEDDAGDGRPRLPRKRYYVDEEPAGPRLTFAHERMTAPGPGEPPAMEQPAPRPGADLAAWAANNKQIIADDAAARAASAAPPTWSASQGEALARAAHFAPFSRILSKVARPRDRLC
jgi:hypothetical protein